MIHTHSRIMKSLVNAVCMMPLMMVFLVIDCDKDTL
jgi:hypothetical protein